MTSDLVALSPQQAAAAGAESLITYGKLFFPRTFRQESPDFHHEIGRRLYSHERYNAVKIFRDGAKTSTLRVYKSQRVAYFLSHTIMYVSVSQPHAKMSLRWLRRHVLYNKRWTNTFGLAPGKIFNDEMCEIQHLNAKPGIDDMPPIVTVLAMGITGQIRGFNPDDYRPDLIIIDDILNEENTATPEQRKKIEDLLFGGLLNSLAPVSEAPLAKAVFLQTPLAKDDAIEKCMKDPQWNPIEFGILDYSESTQGKSRWESRYPTEQVLKDKQSHILRSQFRLWMREKEVKIVSGEEKAIDISKFKIYDVLPSNLDVVITIDPASSDSDTADDHAVVALGCKGLDIFIMAYGLSKATMPDKAANDFFSLMLLTRPRKLIVESISYQRVLKWYIEQEMIKKRLFLPVEAFQTKVRKANRIMGTIPGLAAFGHFWIGAGMSELLTQADDYNPEAKNPKDDLLDAIATGIMDLNPALRHYVRGGGDEDEEEGRGQDYLDESQYKPLQIGGCP